MPVPNYSVLKGKPTAGKVVKGKGTHYQITVQANGGPFTVAVNIESTDGSEVLYEIDHMFTPPDIDALDALAAGITPVSSAPGGLALDFVREQANGHPLVTKAELTLLPIMSGVAAWTKKQPLDSRTLRAQALSNAITTLIAKAIADGNTTLYAFGSAYADSGRVDGIHNIHMNQGNPNPGSFAADNGIWQDGAMFLQMPTLNTAPTWVAVFIAFQTESWNTDDQGNPM